MKPQTQTLGRAASTLLCGALFGFGLALSGMVRPDIVLSFLHFRDLGLMLVMGGAVAVVLVTYKAVPRWMRHPLWGGEFQTHPSTWNSNTALGAALFGVGWGLSGLCPGAAIAALGTGSGDILWGVGAMALGALTQGWVKDRRPSRG
ncbi:DUF6691 family protein [Inhella gelatinilytica]|uniref:YeeE/YedE family protein n=1 Tax=Inhella gelatinilytica TaxID=2795030 RepID=A0A931IWU1_9BURK|nr:DUF6691 family protein [Inhella gelatinilytica]MBH9554320.1 YeeE/YedE family protein [Inhella gelatinilytica]